MRVRGDQNLNASFGGAGRSFQSKGRVGREAGGKDNGQRRPSREGGCMPNGGECGAHLCDAVWEGHSKETKIASTRDSGIGSEEIVPPATGGLDRRSRQSISKAQQQRREKRKEQNPQNKPPKKTPHHLLTFLFSFLSRPFLTPPKLFGKRSHRSIDSGPYKHVTCLLCPFDVK
jgi:hypothetical protein